MLGAPFLMQFDAQSMNHHAPTRGYFSLKTQKVYFLYGLRPSWVVKVRFGGDQISTIFGNLIAVFFGKAHLTNHCCFSLQFFRSDICLLPRHNIIKNHSVWASGWSDVEMWL